MTPLDELPELAAPAVRALHAAGWASLRQLAGRRRADLARLHRVVPTALARIQQALEQHRLSLS
jgi:hypothetical protein